MTTLFRNSSFQTLASGQMIPSGTNGPPAEVYN